MENITKALLIVGGILIVIMLLTLIMTAVNQISTYYSLQHNEKILEQTVDFNSKFENYAGQTIRGNELLSVINRVIDYNNYQAGMEGYDEITFLVDMKGRQNEFMDDKANAAGVYPVIKRNITNDNMNEISNLPRKLTSDAESGIAGLTEIKLQKLAAEIHNIAYENVDETYRIQRLKKILGRKDEYTFSAAEIRNIKKATALYFQLMQFKRAMFKCEEVLYNAENGRVNNMKFEVVIENGYIKYE